MAAAAVAVAAVAAVAAAGDGPGEQEWWGTLMERTETLATPSMMK